MRLARATAVQRVDHDRWRTDGGEVVRVPGADLVLHGVRYEFLLGEDGEARVVGAEKLPWSERLAQALFGPAAARSPLEQIMANPAVLSAKKEAAARWLRAPERLPVPAEDALMRLALDGEISAERTFAACGAADHPAVGVCVWAHELREAMKRHRAVWVSSRLTKNGYLIRDDEGLRRLVAAGRVVLSGPRVTFAWAAEQVRAAALPPAHVDDADCPPSEDLSRPRGDLAARVDAFVDRRRVCNTMLRDRDWEPANPFVLRPERVERVPRHRLREWRRLAEAEGALFVGDAEGCVVALRGDRPVRAVPHAVRQDLLVLDGRETMPCAAAQTQLRSVRVDSFADLLTALPAGCRFPLVYAAEDAGTQAGWVREAARFGPLVLLKVG